VKAVYETAAGGYPEGSGVWMGKAESDALQLTR
jgi:hypothetical protein